MQLVRTLSGKPNFSRSVVTFQIYCKPGAKQWPTVKLPSRTDQQIFGEICRACRRTVQQPHFGSVSIIFQVWSVKDWSQPPFSLILGCSLVWNARTQLDHPSRVSEFKIASRRVGPTTCTYRAQCCRLLMRKLLRSQFHCHPPPMSGPLWPIQGNFLVLS